MICTINRVIKGTQKTSLYPHYLLHETLIRKVLLLLMILATKSMPVQCLICLYFARISYLQKKCTTSMCWKTRQCIYTSITASLKNPIWFEVYPIISHLYWYRCKIWIHIVTLIHICIPIIEMIKLYSEFTSLLLYFIHLDILIL